MCGVVTDNLTDGWGNVMSVSLCIVLIFVCIEAQKTIRTLADTALEIILPYKQFFFFWIDGGIESSAKNKRKTIKEHS